MRLFNPKQIRLIVNLFFFILVLTTWIFVILAVNFMEIVNKNAALLSNSEVFTLLKETKEKSAQKLIKKKNLDPNNSNFSTNVDKHLPTVVYESLKYLERTPCVKQTPQIVDNFLTKLDEKFKEFNLTKVEKLQLLNQRPASAVELQCLIEDSEERFTIEQMDDLLEFVLSNLPDNQESEENFKSEALDHDSNN
ncbi:DNA-directed RNA polymerase III subunit RPC9 [Brachionus plicatilis]|uniref:DNA-directed RNA polymerase III subunit RPC9 n=1 Tax=Brachionus plicatilis TaxID=10195 RepID=A0A3M7PNI6_BRAPC|nr:DNA-directed RNA polymerase III subunit RPC9 [Brachionus plicatilis]